MTDHEQPEDSSVIRDLRKQIKDLTDQNKTLAEKVRVTAFRDAGFDPTKGMGKALAQLYQGDADADLIKEFAVNEFGWEPGKESTGTSAPGADRVRQGGDRVSAAMGTSTAVDGDDYERQLAEAIKSGDAVAAIGLKINRLRDEINM